MGSPCVLHVHHGRHVQPLGNLRAIGIEQKGHTFPPGCVCHLRDAHLQHPSRRIAVVNAYGILLVSGADGVGEEHGRACTHPLCETAPTVHRMVPVFGHCIT